MPARLILLCGLPGSGKSTTALRLERDLGAIRFSPDEWMARLGIDLFDQTARGRIESLQWEVAERLLQLGCVVVIEWGVWSRTERDELRERARGLGAKVELRYLDAPLDLLWDRVRNRGMEQTWGSAALTYENLVEYTGMFDPPDDDELALFDPPAD